MRRKLWLLIPIFAVLVLINKYNQPKIVDDTIVGSRVIEIMTNRVKNNLPGKIAGNVAPPTGISRVPTVPGIIFVPPEGKITVKNGKVKVQTKGLTFHPGFNFGVTGNGTLSAGVDFKFLYWNRFGANLGLVGLTTISQISPAAGISYSLAGHGFLLNTELDVKYAPRYLVPLWVGLRWNF